MRFRFSGYRSAVVLASVLFVSVAARADKRVSERQEMAAGRRIARQVERRWQVVTGTRQAALVEQIGRRLAQVSGRPHLAWRFCLLKEKTPNAFSLPGRVYVFTGLVDACGDDRDALAGVIAHEVAHTTARHARKQMENGLAVGFIRALVFGHDEEYEADRLAVRYLRRAGYDPRGMIRLLRTFQKRDGKDGDQAAWLNRHPGNRERIAQIRHLIYPSESPAD